MDKLLKTLKIAQAGEQSGDLFSSFLFIVRAQHNGKILDKTLFFHIAIFAVGYCLF
jgi:hypothetical protein